MKLRRDPKIIKDKHLRIATAYNSGMKIADIRKKFNCSTGTIYHAIHKVINDEKDN